MIGSENPATLSPLSYPPSINFEHWVRPSERKSRKAKASRG